MDVLEAYKIAKKTRGNNILVDCRDFKEAWGFAFTSKRINPDELMLGSGYYAVNKVTGDVEFLAIIEVLDLLTTTSSITINLHHEPFPQKVKTFLKTRNPFNSENRK